MRAHPAVPAPPLSSRLAPLLLILLATLAAPAAGATHDVPASTTRTAGETAPARTLRGVAVEGSDRAVVRLPAAGADQKAAADAEGEAKSQAAPGLSSYVNTGYRLRLGEGTTAGEGTAVVEVELGPLESSAPFQLPTLEEGAEASRVEALAREITGRSATLYGAVSSVLGWVVHNVVTDETAALVPTPAAGGEGEAEPGSPRGDDPRQVASKQPVSPQPVNPGQGSPAPQSQASPELGSQEPEDVIARGSGDSGGIARLTVALLRAVGIEARTVRGRVVGTPEVGGPWGPHTWVEVRYPDAGWVFSDPLHHHHYVPANYLRLPPSPAKASEDEPPGSTAPRQPGGEASDVAATAEVAAVTPGDPAGATGERGDDPSSPAPVSAYKLVERRDLRQVVDLYPLGGPGVTARRNRAVQRAGALRVVVSGSRRGSAVLEGGGGRTSKILIDGESVFVGLATGDYRLEVYLEDEAPIVRQLELGPRERRAIFLRRDAEGDSEAAEGKPGGSGGRDLPPPDHYRSRQPTASQNSP